MKVSKLTIASVLWLLAAASPAAAWAQPAPVPTQPVPTQPVPGQPTAQQPAPGQAPPANWGPGMSAGGLAPPPPLTNQNQTPGPTGTPPNSNGQTPPSTDFRPELDKSKDKDSGRGLSWFWVDAYGGFEHAGLQTFNKSKKEFAAGIVPTVASGGIVGGGIGAQIFFVTIGVRGRMGFFDGWQMGRVGGEVGFRFPLGRLEPHFDVGGGYSGLGHLGLEPISIQGGYARVGGGLDIFPVKVLSIGPALGFDFLGMSRSALTPTEVATLQKKHPEVDDTKAALLQKSGTGLGASFSIVAVIGIHL